MHLLTIVLTISILFYGTPSVADSSFTPPRLLASTDRIDLQSPWPPISAGTLLAQDSVAPPQSSQIDFKKEIAALIKEREGIRTGGPRTVAIVGAVVTGLGALLAVSAALACEQADNDDSTRCDEDRADQLKIGGGIAAGVGLVALIGGLITLGSRKNHAKRIDGQIRNLKRRRFSLPENVSARLGLSDKPSLMVTVTY